MIPVITLTANPAIDISTSTYDVTPIRKLRCTAARYDAGGGGINVARVVRRLGAEVDAIYLAGGSTGQLLRQLVEREGIPSRAINVADETRQDFTVLEEKSGNQFRFVLPGPLLAEHDSRVCLAALETMDRSQAFLVCSGSLPRGVSDDFYADAARIAKGKGWKVILDTSGQPLAAALKEGVFVVKPNLRELEELVDARLTDQTAWLRAARSLITSKSAEMVALTLGERGALLVSRHDALHARALDIHPTSTVGAGDSFVGGMVWSLAAGHSIDDAFRYGVAAGSAAVLNSGTELCHAADVARLYPQIELRRI